MGVISVKGASEHNLQDVSVEIPKCRLVAFTGVSGSGKSSLVFETIYAEAFRRFADASAAPVYVLGNTVSVLRSRPRFRAITGLPPALGLSQRQGVAGRLSTVGTLSGVADLLRVYFAVYGQAFCRHCDIPLRSMQPSEILERVLADYQGRTITVVATVAERRKGGFASEIEKFRQLGYSRLRVNGEVHDLQDEGRIPQIDAKKLNTIEVLIDRISVSASKEKRIERALSGAIENGKGVVRIESEGASEIFNTRSSCPQCGEAAPVLDPRHFSHSSLGKCETCEGSGTSGETESADLFPCPACGGSRLSGEMPVVRLLGRTIADLLALAAADLLEFVQGPLGAHAGSDKGRTRVIDEARRILKSLVSVGVGHLPMNRAGGSLVPGDLQRIRLASIVSNRLRGALYVLDEPCQGLTSLEVQAFVKVLRNLVDGGASVVVVEHHPVFLEHCDVVFTMGPGAGVHGGRVVNVEHRAPGARRPNPLPRPAVASGSFPQGALELSRIQVRNLRLAELRIPLQALTLIRGPSGHGKQSLLELCIEPALRGVLDSGRPPASPFFKARFPDGLQVVNIEVVNPGSLTRTSRRTIAAALDILPHLRAIFAKLPQAQILGLSEPHFSWGSKQGRCEECEGKGVLELVQRFGSTVEIPCSRCLGARLSTRSLVPRFKGYNFAEVMKLSIEDALREFQNYRLIESRLSGAVEFGLGYLQLGQSLDSLSGGELQRLLLTLQLRRAHLEGNWFLLVHPGTGLHAPDIERLGALLTRMAAKGASFVAIENREEFLPFAHHVVEL